MQLIAKDDRYLIAELACKTYEPKENESLVRVLTSEFRRLTKANASRITFRDLIGQKSSASVMPRQGELEFSIDEVLDDHVENEASIGTKIQPLIKRFEFARQTALKNTEQYISMIDDR
jgi:hypothetical protein